MKNSKKGFTIVELVIVIAVIAILAAVLIPTFSGVVGNAKEAGAKESAKNAYSQYLAENADSGEDLADDFIYVDADDRVVAIENGNILGVYDAEADALNEFDGTATKGDAVEGNDKLYLVTVTPEAEETPAEGDAEGGEAQG